MGVVWDRREGGGREKVREGGRRGRKGGREGNESKRTHLHQDVHVHGRAVDNILGDLIERLEEKRVRPEHLYPRK